MAAAETSASRMLALRSSQTPLPIIFMGVDTAHIVYVVDLQIIFGNGRRCPLVLHDSNRLLPEARDACQMT